MKLPEIGDVLRGQHEEFVVEQVHYTPSTNYQGQGDQGCYSQSPSYWSVFARKLNQDGSYNQNGSIRKLTLMKSSSNQYQDYSDQVMIVRQMQVSFS